ncbi:MAG: VirK/YbjX family protein [Cetobacterium sp.]|uniref:VirK/YbjX family protein n=1 Tax=Cetobacterium sp. TaxID=2071632 RepID=UPI003F36E9C5
MTNSLNLFADILKKGENKGQLNTKKKKIKFFLRTILTLNYSLRLNRFILNHKYLKSKVYSYPVLISKIHRPYLKKNFKTSEKLNTIINTYKTIDNIFENDFLEKLYLNNKITLAEILGKDNTKFFISLELYPVFDKEGEINLKLLDENNVALSTITFSFIENKNCDSLNLFIGGIQGAPKDIDKEYIKKATKNLHGIFPKKLLIEVLYILEDHLKISIKKFSVSNESHIYKSQRYLRKRIIHSSYDEFLQSLDSKKLSSGIWELPEKLSKKSLEDIPSSKRSQHLKKMNILEQIEKSIGNLNN